MDPALSSSFPLILEVDLEDVEFTHIKGAMGHVRMLRELPVGLFNNLSGVLEYLVRQEVKKLSFDPKDPFHYLINGNRMSHTWLDCAESREALRLTAWWMEWDRRRTISHEGWYCLNCGRTIVRKRGHCDYPDCESWNMLNTIIGETSLHLVETDTA